MRTKALGILLAAGLAAGAARAEPIDWRPFSEASVIEILTVDPGGAARETKVWIVVEDEAGYVRTNDSRWLANLRRDPSARLRAGETVVAVRAEEVSDDVTKARVEEAFKAKYGWMQRVMSALRLREPTVLRLSAPPR